MERRYEGADVLEGYLRLARSTYSAQEVAEEFQGAQRAGATPDDVLPVLFHHEPHFGDPDEALRLYSNLFGLWDSLVNASHQPEALNQTLIQLAQGRQGPAPVQVVDAIWRETMSLSEARCRSEWDRFVHTQPELQLYVEGGCGELVPAAFDTVIMIVFEVWRVFTSLWPGKISSLSLSELQAAGAGADGLDREPAVADFVAEALELAVAEAEELLPGQNSFGEAEVIRAKGLLGPILALWSSQCWLDSGP